MSNNAIIVLGMHRSGTSALTGVLSLLGIHVGDSLLPAAAEVNPKGFWEHAGIVSLHDRLLTALGSSWHDERNLPEDWWARTEVEPFRQELAQILRTDFTGITPWAIKDPRLCRLLPLWQPVLQQNECLPRVIMILRDPREVAKSLARRDCISEQRSYLLWLQHVLEAEKWSRDCLRVLITYEELLANWRSTIDRINAALSLDLHYNDMAIQKTVDAFLEPSLRHHTAMEPPLGRLAHLACAAYRGCTGAGAPDRLETTLAPLAAETAEVVDLVAPWSKEIQALWHVRSELANRESHIEILNKEIARIRGTVSWRITAPLRVMWNVGRKLFGKDQKS